MNKPLRNILTGLIGLCTAVVVLFLGIMFAEWLNRTSREVGETRGMVDADKMIAGHSLRIFTNSPATYRPLEYWSVVTNHATLSGLHAVILCRESKYMQVMSGLPIPIGEKVQISVLNCGMAGKELSQVYVPVLVTNDSSSARLEETNKTQ